MFILVACFATSTASGEELIEKAVNLSKLRSEVESLSSQLEQKNAEYINEHRTLEAQKSDLTLQVRREEAILAKLDEKNSALEVQVENASKDDALRKVVAQGLDDLERSIEASLPYRIVERKEGVAEIRSLLKSNELSTTQAATRLWGLLDDENRLSSENQLDRQLIELNGERLMVDTMRIGMIAIFFKTADNRYGYLQKTNGKWLWILTEDEQQKEQIADLYFALQRGIRSGRFGLPQTWEIAK